MNNIIITQKTRKKEGLSKSIVDITVLAEVAQSISVVDLIGKYICTVNNVDLNTAKKLGLTSIKKC